MNARKASMSLLGGLILWGRNCGHMWGREEGTPICQAEKGPIRSIDIKDENSPFCCVHLKYIIMYIAEVVMKQFSWGKLSKKIKQRMQNGRCAPTKVHDNSLTTQRLYVRRERERDTSEVKWEKKENFYFFKTWSSQGFLAAADTRAAEHTAHLCISCTHKAWTKATCKSLKKCEKISFRQRPFRNIVTGLLNRVEHTHTHTYAQIN